MLQFIQSSSCTVQILPTIPEFSIGLTLTELWQGQLPPGCCHCLVMPLSADEWQLSRIDDVYFNSLASSAGAWETPLAQKWGSDQGKS